MQRLVIFLAVLLIWLVPSVFAQQPDGVTAVITAPGEGEQLFGQITIIGSADHSTTFGSYTLEYNDLRDPGADWLLVQPRIQQRVQNGTLGVWNTVVVPDGTYALRLRVFLTDGQQAGEYVVSNLSVINSEPTPVPTAAGDSAVSSTAPAPGPSPTSPIQQPPSNNPSGDISGLDSSGTGADAPPPAFGVDDTDTDQTTRRVNTTRVRSAFCTGVYLTLGLFGFMILYLLVRGRLRPYTRRLLWQIQDEFDRDRQ
ncbi:MAG: hypothetical protein JXQ72_13870 [Anaerolineae bacterium]|nr:hypothetical protein [Anaerolineae bacterium]